MRLSILKRFLRRRSKAADMRREDEIMAEANDHLRDALNQDKQEGVLLAVRARWATMFVVALFLPYLNFSWEILYYEVLLGVFSYIGYLQLRASRVGHSKRELLLIFCDLALMTIICVVPNPFDAHEHPLAVQYRFGTFLYFFVLLAGATLAYSWRTILAYGVWTSVLWSGGLIYVSKLGSEVPELSINVATALGDYGHLLQFLDPNDPNVPGRVQEILVFFIVAGILALRGWRANRLLLKQVDASLEEAKYLTILKDEAEKTSRAKSEFLANMSHELRTPLNPIIGFSQVLKDETFGPLGSDQNKEYVGIIHSSGVHLHKIIGDILDLSKIEAGEEDLVEEKVEIVEVFEECKVMMSDRLAKKQLTFLTKTVPGVPPLWADRLKVKQILLNLLSNAIKFTPENGSISVDAQLTEQRSIQIIVRDTGVGIAPNDIKRILEPFGQSGETYTRSYDGAGLGLALVSSLVDMHEGTLEIESELGEYTLVTVKFPPERTVFDS